MTKPNRKLPQLTPQQKERFYAKIEIGSPTECWEWRASRDPENYGTWQPWKKAQPYRAHRFAFFLHSGIDPAEQCVLHICDNPPCCNPNHLQLGTNLDNTADRVRKGRSATGERVRPKRSLNGGYKGEGHPSAKLTEQQVHEIRNKYKPRQYSLNRLAREYGVAKRTVLTIIQRKHWSHI